MRTVRWIIPALAVAVLAVGECLGADEQKAPTVEPRVPWTAIIGSLIAVAAICVVAFKKSGRTHLD